MYLSFYRCRNPTKVTINRVDNERQRVSLATGKIIPKPQESMQRHHPVTAAVGPKDTLPNDVFYFMMNNHLGVGSDI